MFHRNDTALWKQQLSLCTALFHSGCGLSQPGDLLRVRVFPGTAPRVFCPRGGSPRPPPAHPPSPCHDTAPSMSPVCPAHVFYREPQLPSPLTFLLLPLTHPQLCWSSEGQSEPASTLSPSQPLPTPPHPVFQVGQALNC